MTEIGSQAFETAVHLIWLYQEMGWKRRSEAFAGCDFSDSVEVPDSVTEFGDSALEIMQNLIMVLGKNGTAWQYAEKMTMLRKRKRIRRAVYVEVQEPRTKTAVWLFREENRYAGLRECYLGCGTSEEVTTGYYAYFKEKNSRNATVDVQFRLSQKKPMKQESNQKEKDYKVFTKMKREMI